MSIDEYKPRTGRTIKEDGNTINSGDSLETLLERIGDPADPAVDTIIYLLKQIADNTGT